MPGIAVIGEGEAVPGIQPAMVRMPALTGGAQGDHFAAILRTCRLAQGFNLFMESSGGSGHQPPTDTV
jgi:hypothetical protein